MSPLQAKNRNNLSSYSSYSKTGTKNILMNKTLIDSGYPQDVFFNHTSYKSNDFIQDNKKNLKNFFKQRLPSNSITKQSLIPKSITFDPNKIYEFKRKQFYLKSQTKMILDDGFITEKNKTIKFHAKKMEKVEQIFCINDKTLEFKKKFQSLNVPRFDSYSKDNHRRGTQSFKEKRSRLLKRQAYQKVFGPDISSISRTLPVSPHNEENQSIQKIKKTRYNSKRSPMIDRFDTKKQDLSKLIKKLDKFKGKIKQVKIGSHQSTFDKINDSNIHNLLELNTINNEDINKQKDKQKVLSLIENITDVYKGQAVQYNRAKIASLDDLERLDSNFYNELNRHKKIRVQKRMSQLLKHNVPQSNELLNNKFNTNSYQVDKFQSTKTKIRKPSDVLSITDYGYQEEPIFKNYSDSQKKWKVHERFKYLGNQLIKAYLLSSFYMINPSYFYPAFWQQRKPFEMEGSYAFFKAIKLNDIQCIKSFINIDINFLYQIDLNGKTPLVYACLNNNQIIVSYFLKLGSNVDKQCDRKKTALFYALQNKNLQIVSLLLQFGASPWSSNDCPYRQKINSLKKEDQLPFLTVFSNAKKINLGVRLQLGSKKRRQFWHQNKNKINSQYPIKF